MDLKPDVLAIPLFALFVFLEARWRAGSGRRPLPLDQAGASTLTGLGQLGSNALQGAALSGLFVAAWQNRVTTVPLDSLATGGLYFLATEFVHYWTHRLSHRVRWMWATHAVHHSSEDLNLAAAFRNGWTDLLSGTWLPWLGLIFIGFNPLAVAFLGGMMRIYGFFLHTEAGPRLRRLGFVLNTPSHHRVHHAVNPEYIDCNFGGTLIIFDRLFGTFAEGREDARPRYGVLPRMSSAHPIVLVAHEWIRLWSDVRSARGWRAVFRAAFGRPGAPPRAPRAVGAVALREAA